MVVEGDLWVASKAWTKALNASESSGNGTLAGNMFGEDVDSLKNDTSGAQGQQEGKLAVDQIGACAVLVKENGGVTEAMSSDVSPADIKEVELEGDKEMLLADDSARVL
jgi:hypothetical protein